MTHGGYAKSGSIIVRQRGTRFTPGVGVMRAKDDSLFAVSAGLVNFKRSTKIGFDGARRKVNVVSVAPVKAAKAA